MRGFNARLNGGAIKYPYMMVAGLTAGDLGYDGMVNWDIGVRPCVYLPKTIKCVYSDDIWKLTL